MTATGRCEFEQGYVDFDGSSASMPCSQDATWLVWSPPRGQQYEDPNGSVGAVCGDHLLLVQNEEPDVEIVQIATLPLTCSSCHAPIWAKHAHDHEVVQAADCQWCKGLAESRAAKGIDIPTATEHAACSCPEEAACLRAMEGIDRVPAGTYEEGACEVCGRRDGLHDHEECFK